MGRKLDRIIHRLLHLEDSLTLLKEAIVATQAEVAAALDLVNGKLTKIGQETTTLLVEINNLKNQIVNGPVTPELQAALDRVVAQAQVVDDLVPDNPVVP